MVHLEAPQSSPELPKSSQKEPGRAPERLQNHFWIEKADFSKMLLFIYENQHFQWWEGRFGSSKSTPRGSEKKKKRHRRRQNPPKAIFGSKRQANRAQENSKMNLEALFGRSGSPSELPRAASELPKVARENPETIAKPCFDRNS